MNWKEELRKSFSYLSKENIEDGSVTPTNILDLFEAYIQTHFIPKDTEMKEGIGGKQKTVNYMFNNLLDYCLKHNLSHPDFEHWNRPATSLEEENILVKCSNTECGVSYYIRKTDSRNVVCPYCEVITMRNTVLEKKEECCEKCRFHPEHTKHNEPRCANFSCECHNPTPQIEEILIDKNGDFSPLMVVVVGKINEIINHLNKRVDK